MQELSIQNISSDLSGFIKNFNGESRVKRIGLFGSVSRGEFRPDSDIDIITEYDFHGDFNMDDYVKYCIFCNALRESLEDIYGRKVDIVDHGEIFNDGNVCIEDVQKDVIWIYDC